MKDVSFDVVPMDVSMTFIHFTMVIKLHTPPTLFQKKNFTFYRGNTKIVLGPTREKTSTQPTFLGDVSHSLDVLCEEKIQKMTLWKPLKIGISKITPLKT